MALGGLSPVIIFTFYKTINTPAFLSSFITSAKIPLVPIPIYLDEKITGLQIDDYNRTISVEVMRDGVTAFERVNGDVVTLKFRAKKDNIGVTALTALFDRIVKVVEKKEYSITIFYDNIFILDAALEQFQTSLIDGTDLREISLTVSNRPVAPTVAAAPIVRVAGTAAGITT